MTEQTLDSLDACDKDDFTTFSVNGTAVDNEGATKCDPTDDQTYSYAWSFLDNETKLKLDFGMGDFSTYNIVSNTGTVLKLENTETYDYTGDMIDDTVIEKFTLTAR